MSKKLIQELPNQTGDYYVTIQRFSEPAFEKHVIYNYEKGRWESLDGDVIGNADQLIHKAEWHDILSYRNPDNFD